jgi:DNA-binding beta-propeller fold protein YncE
MVPASVAPATTDLTATVSAPSTPAAAAVPSPASAAPATPLPTLASRELPAGEPLATLSDGGSAEGCGTPGRDEFAIETKKEVHIVDVATGCRVATVPTPKVEQINGLHITDDSVWFLDHDNGRVLRVDRTNGKVVARIPVGYRAVSIIKTAEGIWAGSGHQEPEMVSLIDPATNTVKRRIEQGAFPVAALGSLWFGKDEHTLTHSVRRVDPATGKVIATIDMESRADACYVGGRFPDAVWTWCFDGINPTIAARLDVERYKVAATVPLGGYGGYVGSSDSASWFFVEGPNRLVRIDLATNTIDRVYAPPDGAYTTIVGDWLWVIDVARRDVRRIPLADL